MTVPAADPERQRRRTIGAAVVGSAVEWYDFTLYGAVAALVLGPLYFPSDNELASTLASFATYAVGFLARPVGAVVFGHLGDRLGRKPALVATLLLMGVATALIGLLPTYAAIGVWAPVLLVVLRLLQGLGAGAEYAGAVLLTAERAPQGRRGLDASWPVTGVWIGIFAATGLLTLLAQLPGDAFVEWGWRAAFLSSIGVVAIGLFIRLRLTESPVFERSREAHEQASPPLVTLVRSQPRELLIAVGAQVGTGYLWIALTWVLAYVTAELELSRSVALNGTLVAAGVAAVTTLAFGALSDRVGRKPVFLGGAAFCTLFAFPFFLLLDTREPLLIILAMTAAVGIGCAAMVGAQAAFYAELFGTSHRFSGFALAREVSSAIAVGPAPLMAAALLGALGGEPWLVAGLMLVMGLVPLLSVLPAPETLGRDLERLPDAVPTGRGVLAQPVAAREP